MVEHLLCKQGVIGSIPFTSTNDRRRVMFIEIVKKRNDLTNQGKLTEMSIYSKRINKLN